jgi:Holliday junction DNA helicase RuvA
MYASLSGAILAVNETTAVLDCSGVGYLLHCPTRTLANLAPNTAARLWVHLAVREDALTLFGFETQPERDFFLSLTTVSGVGPKVGLSLLSTFTPNEIVQAISANQPSHLARASGVGKKLAEKIIVELKDKLGSLPLMANTLGATNGLGARIVAGPMHDLCSALINLGYAPKIAETAAQQALDTSPDAPFEVQFKSALSFAVRG